MTSDSPKNMPQIGDTASAEDLLKFPPDALASEIIRLRQQLDTTRWDFELSKGQDAHSEPKRISQLTFTPTENSPEITVENLIRAIDEYSTETIDKDQFESFLYLIAFLDAAKNGFNEHFTKTLGSRELTDSPDPIQGLQQLLSEAAVEVRFDPDLTRQLLEDITLLKNLEDGAFLINFKRLVGSELESEPTIAPVKKNAQIAILTWRASVGELRDQKRSLSGDDYTLGLFANDLLTLYVDVRQSLGSLLKVVQAEIEQSIETLQMLRLRRSEVLADGRTKR